jgi:hypothetical protein
MVVKMDRVIRNIIGTDDEYEERQEEYNKIKRGKRKYCGV